MHYQVPMRLEYDVIVLVEADSAQAAEAKAKEADFVDDGHNGGELVNWEIRGKVREDE